MAPKRLSMNDMVNLDEYKKERERYTNQDAQSLGYPSAVVLRMADRLSDIAGKWRKTKERRYINEYQKTLSRMMRKGYDVDTLPVDDQLPKPIMTRILSSISKSNRALGWIRKQGTKIRLSSKGVRIAETRVSQRKSKRMSKSKSNRHLQDSTEQ